MEKGPLAKLSFVTYEETSMCLPLHVLQEAHEPWGFSRDDSVVFPLVSQAHLTPGRAGQINLTQSR